MTWRKVHKLVNDIILQMNGLKKGRECYCGFFILYTKFPPGHLTKTIKKRETTLSTPGASDLLLSTVIGF